MYQEILVEKRIEDGRRLIEALDAAGLKPRAALWYHSSETDRWRLAISLPMVDEAGPLKTYEKIRSILLKLKPPPQVTLSNITVQSRASVLIGIIKATLRDRSEGFKYIGKSVDYSLIDEAYIYRI